ncbi:Protein hcp1 [Streptomyces sp. RB5]|uniref:Protein hcp1 n=1 Tax=Streptomyces smaragdinus TaxID=2585196 RepID=A0A7K0CPR6_9ACTN|nr:Protein hcp1 [Streptomyces smaragdinus]
MAAEHEQPGVSGTYFLQIDGIPGTSTNIRHQREIEIESYSLGVMTAEAVPGGGGGGGAGKPEFIDFSFTKAPDSTSPLIFKSAVTGTHHKKAVLTADKGGDQPQTYLKITMEDVIVSGFSTSGQSEDSSSEEVSLDYGKITMSSLAPDGTFVTTCWNRKTAKAC